VRPHILTRSSTALIFDDASNPSPIRPSVAIPPNRSGDSDSGLDFESDDDSAHSGPSLSLFRPFLDRILAEGKNYTIPPPFSGSLSFIPSQSFPGNFSSAIRNFEENRNPEPLFQLNFADFGSDIECQLEFIRFLHFPETNLSKFVEFSLDSRISSILHFLLSSKGDPPNRLLHLLHAAEDFLKSPEIAPISSLFPGFTFQNIIQQICQSLTSIFPRNSEISSLIRDISRILPSVQIPHSMLMTMKIFLVSKIRAIIRVSFL
jgi:hypothetical protein